MAKKEKAVIERNEDIDEGEFLDDLSSLLGDDKQIETISALDMKAVDPSKMISTNLLPLDLTLGGGICRGRLYEISGPESNGKSTLCDSIVAAWLNHDPKALCLRIESESTMDKIRCEMIGIDLKRVFVFETLVLEEGYDQIQKFQEKVYSRYGESVPLLIVWDTLTAAAPKNEVDGDVYCFTGDTKVKTLSGENKTMTQLCEDFKNNKKNWVYSWSNDTGWVISEVINACKTKKVNQLIKVTLDNNEIIKCTLDHKFMTRDGEYREAKDLIIGESLMPLYSTISDKSKYNLGYEKIIDNNSKKEIYTHRLASLINREGESLAIKNTEDYNSKGKRSYVVCHHKDGNSLNNDPDNLMFLNSIDHFSFHSKHMNKICDLWKNPEFRNFMKDVSVEAAKNQHKNPEFVQKIRQGRIDYMHKILSNPDYLEFMSLTSSLKNYNNSNFDFLIKRNKSQKQRKCVSDSWSSGDRKSKHIEMSKGNYLTRRNLIKKGCKLVSLGLELNEKNYSVVNDPKKTRSIRFSSIEKLFGSVDNWKFEVFEEIEELSLEKKARDADIANKRKRQEELREKLFHNHKVINIEKLDVEDIDVYDITVSNKENVHNFALSAGVIVHNCGGMMEAPRINSREMRKLNFRCAEYNHSAIIIQQVREAGKDRYGNQQYSTTGGQAIKHYFSARISVKRREPIFSEKKADEVVGYVVELKMLKNKLTGSVSSVPCEMYLISGFSPIASMARFATEDGQAKPFINAAGAWVNAFDENGEVYGKYNGVKKFIAALGEDPYLQKLIEYAAYYNKAQEHEIYQIKYSKKIDTLREELNAIKAEKEKKAQETKAEISEEENKQLDDMLSNALGE